MRVNGVALPLVCCVLYRVITCQPPTQLKGDAVPRASRPAARVAAGTANPREVAAWADELPDKFLTCRDMGHQWRPHSARWDSKERAYVRVLRCGRCKTDRVQVIDAYGGIVSGSYDYPDGYTAPSGTGRINGDGRSALRLTSTLRLVSRFGED